MVRRKEACTTWPFQQRIQFRKALVRTGDSGGGGGPNRRPWRVEQATPDQSFACQAAGLGKTQNNALERQCLTASVILVSGSSSGCREMSERASCCSTACAHWPATVAAKQGGRCTPRDVHARRSGDVVERKGTRPLNVGR